MLTVTHAKVNTVPDNPSDVDTGGVLASDWNSAHTVAGSIDATDLPSTVVNAVSNDSNVTGTIATQTLTLGWSGTLPVARGGLNTSTAPSAAQVPIATGSTTYVPTTISGDAALSSTGGLTVTKTNGVAFAASATTDATNASNISSGTLAVGRGGLNTSTAPTLAQVPIATGTTTYTPKTIGGDATLTSTGALTVTKTNGSAFAASATVDATNATNISSGTLAAGRLNANVVQAVTNDTNVTGSIGTQTLTLGWNGTLGGSRGGTGVNNGTSTITVGGNVTFSGAHTFTGSLSANTSVTFPTAGTLASTSVAQTWSATQTFNNGDFLLAGGTSGTTTLAASATASGTITFPATTDTVALLAASQTLTNKTLSSTNTIGGVTIAVGSDATGDLHYRNASGVLTRLAVGTGSQVLGVSGGLPAWVTNAASLTVGSTSISGGTTGRVLYDNAGTLGEATVTGSLGNVVLSASPTLSGTVTMPDSATWTSGGINNLVSAGIGTGTFFGKLAVNFASSTAIGVNNTGAVNGSAFAQFFSNGTGIGSITNNNNTGTAFNTVSDKRLKKDLGIATDASVLERTVIRDFIWLASGKRGIGVFAQDEKGAPNDAVLEGNEERYWQVDYSKFVPSLILGWQQHQKKIKELEARLGGVLASD